MPLCSILWSFSFGISFRDSLVSRPEKSYFKVYFFGQCLFSSLGSAFCSKLLLMSAIQYLLMGVLLVMSKSWEELCLWPYS